MIIFKNFREKVSKRYYNITMNISLILNEKRVSADFILDIPLTFHEAEGGNFQKFCCL
jgi:hypothetical protein